METIEMDLMQAQIGSLASDVSRLEAKVAAGGGGGDVVFEITDVQTSQVGTNMQITGANINATWSELTSAINSGKKVIFHTVLNAGGNNIIEVKTNLVYVSLFHSAITQVGTSAIFDYMLLPAVVDMIMYEDELEEDVINIGGWLITLITE